MAKAVDPSKASNYITKSEEALMTARESLENRRYNSAVTNAVHSGINALDALTAKFKGKRGTDDHIEALLLAKGILGPQEFSEIEKQFLSLINMKNASEYQPDLMDEDDARDAIKWSERISDKVKARLNP